MMKHLTLKKNVIKSQKKMLVWVWCAKKVNNWVWVCTKRKNASTHNHKGNHNNE